MMVCIILHNLIIDVEGVEHTQAYVAQHGAAEEEADHGPRHPPLNQVDDDDDEYEIVGLGADRSLVYESKSDTCYIVY